MSEPTALFQTDKAVFPHTPADWWRVLDLEADIAPIAARNPAFAAALHRNTTRQSDLATLAAFAADPDTPPATLLALAGLFPAQFCANPVFPLLLLEHPDLPTRMDAAAMGWLLAYAGVPADFLAYVATHYNLEAATAARLHINLVEAIGPTWEMSLQTALADLLCERRHPIPAGAPTNVPLDAIDSHLLHELSGLDAIPPWLAVWLQRATPGAEEMYPQPRPLGAPPNDHRLARATDPATPLDELTRLAVDENPWIRCAVARNPATPGPLLAQMKEAEDWSDCDHAVYAAIAANLNTPPELLEHFAADQSPLNTLVRRVVANNPNATVRALEHLAEEICATDIRHRLIRHPHLPPQLRERVQANTLNACLNSGQTLYRAIAFAHPTTATTNLLEGARSPAWLERLAVAHNSSAPSEALALLAEDSNRLVRTAARERMNTERGTMSAEHSA